LTPTSSDPDRRTGFLSSTDEIDFGVGNPGFLSDKFQITFSGWGIGTSAIKVYKRRRANIIFSVPGSKANVQDPVL
jgi:hypothetical protein